MSEYDNSKVDVNFDFFLVKPDERNYVTPESMFVGLRTPDAQNLFSTGMPSQMQPTIPQPPQAAAPQDTSRTVSQSPDNQQAPAYRPQPPVHQQTTPKQPKLTSGCLLAIGQELNCLWVYTAHNLKYPIWYCTIERIRKVIPDQYYRQSVYYEIHIAHVEEPVRIDEGDLTRTGALREALAKASGFEVATYGFPRKMDELLRKFIQNDPEEIKPKLHYGWTTKESLDFLLCNGKTHGEKNAQLSSQETTPPTPLSTSAALTALQQTSEIMYTIADDSVRHTLWVYSHAAILYSLLAADDFQLSTGLCIYSQNQNVRRCMEELLSWFGDKAISLEETPASLRDHMIERKDQPLVLSDENGSINNIKTLITCLQTGEIPYSEKAKIKDSKLNALPTVISAGNSSLRYNNDLFLLEIDGDDLAEDAYARIRNLKCYFEEYLFSFVHFIRENFELLAPTVRKHIDAVYAAIGNDYDVPRKILNSIGILAAVSDLSRMHLEKILPHSERDFYLEVLLPPDCSSLLLTWFRERVQSQNPPADIANLFFEKADQMIRQNLFDIRSCDNINALDPCAEGKLGIIYTDAHHVNLNADSYSAICNNCPLENKLIKHALRDEKHFLGPTVNSSTVQSYVNVPLTDGSRKQIHVYKFERNHFKSLKVETRLLKDDAECDFILQLGESADGYPMSWRGIENSHIGITGLSGTGKSFFIRKMAAQLPKQNVRCIILDCAGDFSEPKESNPEGWPVPDMQVINMKESPIQMLPMTPIYPGESQGAIAKRIVDTISVPLGFGKRQQSLLLKTITEGLKTNCLNEFTDLRGLLKNVTKSKDTAESILLALHGLWDDFPKNGQSFDWDFANPGITVLNLHQGFGNLTLTTFLEILLGSVYSARMTVAHENYPPLVLVLDECHRLTWSENSFANRIMREGRKYGLATILSTQYLTDKNIRNAFGQTELRIAFRPSDNDASQIARMHFSSRSSKQQKLTDQLKALHRGQFLFVRDGEIFVSADPAK